MSYLDYTVLLLMVLFAIGGLIRGLGRSFSSLVVWLFAFAGGCLFTDNLVGYLLHYVDDPVFAYLLTFLTTFFAILLVLGFVNLILGLFLIGTHKGLANRIMGSIIGLVRAVLAAFLAVFIISGVPGSKADWITNSWAYHWLEPWAITLQHKINFPQSSSSKPSSSKPNNQLDLTDHSFMQ